MRVGDILRSRKATRIATVRMNETVATAAQLLRAQDVGALVVKDVCRTEGNVAVGMVSELDVRRALAAHGKAGLALKVAALISVQGLVSCGSDDTLEHAHALMCQHRVGHLPVIDDCNLVGVISLRDIEMMQGGNGIALAPTPAPAAVAPSPHP